MLDFIDSSLRESQRPPLRALPFHFLTEQRDRKLNKIAELITAHITQGLVVLWCSSKNVPLAGSTSEIQMTDY